MDNFEKNNDEKGRVIISLERKSFKLIFAIIAIAILLFWAITHTDSLIGILRGVLSLFSPFIIGLCIAFIINCLLRPLENLWEKLFKKAKRKFVAKLKRPVCLVLSALIVFGALFALVFMIAPEFKTTVQGFIENIPQYIKKINSLWDSVRNFADNYGAVLPELKLNSDEVIKNLRSLVLNNDSLIFNKTIDITTTIVSVVVNIVIALAFSIYILAQKEKLGKQCKRVMRAFLKEERVEKILSFMSLTNRTFTNFVTGQLTEAVIIGVLCFIGMLIFRMPYASVISVLVGATALIPVFGALIGTVVGAFLILLISPIKAVWFVVFILVLQQLEGNLIYPRVVGKSVGLPGIWVLFAVTVGNSLMGVAGMLLSVPICAVLYCILRETVNARISKKDSPAIAKNKE